MSIRFGLKMKLSSFNKMLNIAIMISYLARSSIRVSHLISTHPNTVTCIVNQIQASITSEAIVKLGRSE
jgi:hypothetical protein